ncbi:6764_t:CDS:2 [Entrophospora sp. SA101]|nr:12363_t:CDS:2 [Entrophospora sp. SA101]CAJ0643066.1 6764_t:CDS:2 [Entrophospora sp. SA101]CAJ0828415.1 15679_t:CDS:2 [Entrophospora sp. SA101]
MTFITFKDDAKNIVEKKPKHKKKSNIVINKKVIDQVKSRYTKTADNNENTTIKKIARFMSTNFDYNKIAFNVPLLAFTIDLDSPSIFINLKICGNDDLKTLMKSYNNISSWKPIDKKMIDIILQLIKNGKTEIKINDELNDDYNLVEKNLVRWLI